MSKKKCILVAAGEMDIPQLRTAIGHTSRENFLIEAADAGYDYLREIRVMPDIVIGDGDSSVTFNQYIKHQSEHPDTEYVCLPTHKDDTDTLAALKEGVKRGVREFYIFGAMGGMRLDHAVANIQCLSWLKSHGAGGYIISENCVFTVINHEKACFSEKYSGWFGAFAMEKKVGPVNIEGMEYNMENGWLQNDFPLGVSNTFTGEKAYISVDQGYTLLVFPYRPDFLSDSGDFYIETL